MGRRKGYNPRQPRDRRGRWSDSGTLKQSSHVGKTVPVTIVDQWTGARYQGSYTPVTRAKGKGIRGRVRAARENRTIPAREQASVDAFVRAHNARIDRDQRAQARRAATKGAARHL